MKADMQDKKRKWGRGGIIRHIEFYLNCHPKIRSHRTTASEDFAIQTEFVQWSVKERMIRELEAVHGATPRRLPDY